MTSLISKTKLHGYKVSSFVGNTDEKVALCTLEEIDSMKDLVDTGHLTFPEWVDPRGLFHLAQANERLIIPIIYNWNVDTVALEKDLFLPFGKEYQIDQSLFSSVGANTLTRNERLGVLAHVLEMYPEYLADYADIYSYSMPPNRRALSYQTIQSFIEEGAPLPLDADLYRLSYFETKKPFIFHSSDPALAIVMNYRVFMSVSHKTTANLGTSGYTETNTYKRAEAGEETERAEMLREIITGYVSTINGMIDRGNSRVVDSPVVMEDTKYSNTVLEGDTIPVIVGNSDKVLLFSRNFTMLPSRQVMHSSIVDVKEFAKIPMKTNPEIYVGTDIRKDSLRDGAKYFSSDMKTEGSLQVGSWVLWEPVTDCSQGIVYGKEYSRYRRLDNTLLRSVQVYPTKNEYSSYMVNPLVIPCRGKASGMYRSMKNVAPMERVVINPVYSEESTPLFSPMREMTPVERASDYVFYGSVASKDGRIYNAELVKSESLFDLSSVTEACEDDVVCDVCAPLVGTYFARASFTHLMSQVQLAYYLSCSGGNISVGYATAHPPANEALTLEELVNFHKRYGLTHYSRKDKSTLFRDIEEVAHEMARPSIKDYIEGSLPEEQIEGSAFRISGVVSRALLAEPCRDPQYAGLNDKLRVSFSAGYSGYTSMVVQEGGQYREDVWIGSLAYRGSRFLKEVGGEAEVSLGWKVNLGLIGRTRGGVVVNPKTTPLVPMNTETGYYYSVIPSLPVVTEPSCFGLDMKKYDEAEAELWADV